MLVVSVALQPEGVLACRANERGHLRAGELRSIHEDQALVLLDAEVAEGAIECNPHVALQPMGWVLRIAVGVQLPQSALVEGCLAGGVLDPVPRGAVHLLVHRQRRRLRMAVLHRRGRVLRHLLLVGLQVAVRQALGQGLPFGVIADQEGADQHLVEGRIEPLNALGNGCLGDRAKPVHEQESSLSVGVAVPQEVGVHGLQHGVQGGQLADGHPHAPDVQVRPHRDLGLRLFDEEASPLGRTVAGRKGDGGILDRDLAAAGDAAVDVDEFQPAVEHHQILWLQVEVHKPFGM
mmetsp:Transcript_52528/g.123379  ORF Transcript_52528/g.123379 Transcript_52528/m.123379 type:complete len:292 (-) Transcript_52528:21-896(-)